jgi:hypothetical protein
MKDSRKSFVPLQAKFGIRHCTKLQISKTLAAGDFELHQAPDVQQHLVAITRNFQLKADTLTQPR